MTQPRTNELFIASDPQLAQNECSLDIIARVLKDYRVPAGAAETSGRWKRVYAQYSLESLLPFPAFRLSANRGEGSRTSIDTAGSRRGRICDPWQADRLSQVALRVARDLRARAEQSRRPC